MASAVGSRRPVVAPAAAPPVPVKAWALWGALCLAFITFILAKWLTGPYATPVEVGPSEQPGWMDTTQLIWQVLAVPAMLATFWWFLVRPWIRERRLATDGLLCIGFFLVAFQDPLTNFLQPWYTTNTNLVNIGAWVNEIPGWMSFGEPGHQIAEPLLFIPPVYVFLWLALACLGTWVMRTAHARYPHWGPYRLLASAFVVLAVVDLVAEGLIFMPLGFYTYAGGPFPILFPDRYHVFPLHEPIFTGLMFTAAAALRYYKDDKGYTLVERGAERIRSPRRRGVYRTLALIGATQLCMLVPYTIPVAIIAGTHTRDWPADVQKRSYLTDFLCGDGTDRACPGEHIPLLRQSDSIRVTPDGDLVIPKGVEQPQKVPFE